MLVKDLEDVVADLGQLGLDLLAVLLDQSDLGGVALSLLLLLDRSDYSPGSTASADDVLVGDGEKVALLDSEVAVLGSDDLHVLNHLCESRISITAARNAFSRHHEPTLVALGLLGQLGQIDSIFVTHGGGMCVDCEAKS